MRLERDRDRQEAASASAEDADVFLAEIEAQLDKIYYTESGPGGCLGLGEKEGKMPLLELISEGCLDSDARSGQTQALSEAEKDHLVAIADWDTRHMALTEAGLGHVGYGTMIRAPNPWGIKAYVEE